MPNPTGAAPQAEEAPPAAEDAAERLPAEITAEVLRKYFTLTRADLDQVERCRGSANRLGFSVQLCTLRWRGHFLADTREVPTAVLEVRAPQVGLLPMLIADYPRDDKTRWAHLERIRRHLGFVRCDRAQRQHLLAHLTSVAGQAPRADALRRPRTSGCWKSGSFASAAPPSGTWWRQPVRPGCSRSTRSSRGT